MDKRNPGDFITDKSRKAGRSCPNMWLLEWLSNPFCKHQVWAYLKPACVLYCNFTERTVGRVLSGLISNLSKASTLKSILALSSTATKLFCPINFTHEAWVNLSNGFLSSGRKHHEVTFLKNRQGEIRTWISWSDCECPNIDKIYLRQNWLLFDWIV